MVELLDLDRTRLSSLTEQIFVAIRDAIVTGKIRPGARLPATREVARAARIGRNTVLNAYDELRRQGIISSRTGSGSVVNAPVRQPAIQRAIISPSEPSADTKTVDVSWNRDLPTRAWSRAMRSSVRAVSEEFPDVREVLGHYLAVRGVQCTAGHIFVTSNLRQAIDLCLRSLGVTQQEILLEDPGSVAVRTLALLARIKPASLPVDSSGGNIAAALRNVPSPFAAYVTPAHQHPSGVVMTSERRDALLRWADVAQGWIIEDDSPATLRRAAEPPLYTMSGRVLHVGTLAYPLAPLTALSYVVAPDALVSRVATMSSALGSAPSRSERFAVGQLLLSRTYQRSLDAMRAAAEQRQRIIAQACTNELLWFVARVTGIETGERAVLWLQQHFDAHSIARLLRDHGIPIDPLQEYALSTMRDALVVRFESVRTEEIEDVVRRIAALVRGFLLDCGGKAAAF